MMIDNLREATRGLHTQIEKENLARHIMDHTIGLQDYKILLLQNYLAYRATETEISRFFPGLNCSKHQRLEKDLENLGMDLESLSGKYVFHCETAAEALGAAYVVEGSALGGRMISEELKMCRNLQQLRPQLFFNPDRQNMEGWKTFKKMVTQGNWSEEETSSAVKKAQETFRFFGTIFREINIPFRLR